MIDLDQSESVKPVTEQPWRALLALATALDFGLPFADTTIVPRSDAHARRGCEQQSAAEICSTGTRALRHWDRARDDRIMAGSGLPGGATPRLRNRFI